MKKQWKVKNETTPTLASLSRRKLRILSNLVTGSELIRYGLDNELVELENIKMVRRYREDEDGCSVDIITQNQEWFRTHDRLEKAKEFCEKNDRVRTTIESVLK